MAVARCPRRLFHMTETFPIGMGFLLEYSHLWDIFSILTCPIFVLEISYTRKQTPGSHRPVNYLSLLLTKTVSNNGDVAIITRIPRHEEGVESVHLIHHGVGNLLRDRNMYRVRSRLLSTQVQLPMAFMHLYIS